MTTEEFLSHPLFQVPPVSIVTRIAEALASGITIEQLEEFYPERPQ